ncbi:MULTISPECIES: flagellar hook protein FlgE [Oceanimonas]|uniref:Flagellar hook protein FlgE n=1 Tax=Oceanimonas doudoroffii TaxID=84158 RepID=A0A233RIS0_9GAMM|nr:MULTISPECIES: flagellar hook protein FlgE [Oceanimonas]NHI00119.1 Flagellar hook protein FlgE [Oceanimonas sp. MB9]OXY83284.1 flagellar hook protein FlgE [Oceanimonas doudoroffii]
MSFNIALSGVNAAQKDLDVTANNIANVNTIGFKESRAEFADVYANSIFANAKTQSGSGVQTAAVAQQFHQGALQFTNNSLDMAINGSGFFVMSDEVGSLDRTFTRAGAFRLNDEGYVVNSQGHYLQTYQANQDGTPAGLGLNTTQPLRIPDKAGEPVATTEVRTGVNLPAKATALDPANFSPTDSSTYTSSTSMTVYDSLGDTHTVTQYFVKDNTVVAPANEWKMFVYVDGNDALASNGAVPANSMTLEFDTSGNLLPASATSIQTDQLGFTNGSDATQQITINITDASMNAGAFEVTSNTQDGNTVGRLTKVDVGADGLVQATYSNGSTENLGIVAMARFPNEQGLTQIGDTQWRQSLLSGEAVSGQPNTGIFGKVSVAALEQSNTNLTSELVDLITAQRNFQANSRALEVNSTLQQTILQIR